MSETNASSDASTNNTITTGTPSSTEFRPITTQEDFDRALGQRLHQERSKYADYEDLKTKAAEFDRLQEGQKTELQKTSDRAAAAERDAAAARAELQDARLMLAVASAARGHGIDPEDAARLIVRADLTFDTDGAPNNLDTVLTALVEAKPYLVANDPRRNLDLGQGVRGDSGSPTSDPLLRSIKDHLGIR